MSYLLKKKPVGRRSLTGEQKVHLFSIHIVLCIHTEEPNHIKNTHYLPPFLGPLLGHSTEIQSKRTLLDQSVLTFLVEAINLLPHTYVARVIHQHVSLRWLSQFLT